MGHATKCLLTCLAVLLLLVGIVKGSCISSTEENGVKTAVFLSPAIELLQGSVADKYYYDVAFPTGHVGLKSFDAETVDENGMSVPLHETYIHHWGVLRYYQRKGSQAPNVHEAIFDDENKDFILVRNKGICDDKTFAQYFGLGSETRKTATDIPDPYGIQVGNPAHIPVGYEEKWYLNVHLIDTRSVVDKLRCSECLCDLYNLTADKDGKALHKDYVGGLRCCYDDTRCRVKEGIEDVKIKLYLKYTVKYIDWHAAIVPVEIYVLDITDTWTKSDDTTKHICQVEYQVESCSGVVSNDGCTDTKSVRLVFPDGVDVIYGVAHQHTGGIGSTLYGEDGRLICTSNAIYGNGKEAGNESGYIIGMTTCYPKPGSVKISKGETVTLVSNYENMKRHTGVMGLFYLLVVPSDTSAKPIGISPEPLSIHEKMMEGNYITGVALIGVAALVAFVVVHQRRNQHRDIYEPIAA